MHWENKVVDWFEPSKDSLVFRILGRPYSDTHSHRSPTGNWGIWYETYEGAVAAIQRFQEGEEPWDRREGFGDYYTEAQYEFRVRKHTFIVEDPITSVGEPHPALLKRETGFAHWKDCAPMRRRVK